MASVDELSEREVEILRLVATGASNKEIAQKLFISTNTVKVHLRNIFNKINAASRTEAAMYAVNAGLVDLTVPFATGNVIPGGSLTEGPPAQHPRAGSDNNQGISPSARNQYKPGAWILGGILLLSIILITWQVVKRLPDQNATAAATPDLPQWQSMAGLPTARAGLALVTYENLIYAIGGQDQDGPSAALERFDPVANTWTVLSSKPTAVRDVAAAVIGGRIYIPGGLNADGAASDRLEIFNPRLETWEQGAPLPIPLSAYALAAFEGKLYIFGGWDGSSYVDTVFVYDPENDAWSQRSPLPSPRAYAGAAAVNGKVYILGGFDGAHSLSDNLIYQPDLEGSSQQPWSQGAPLPEGRSAPGVVGIAEMIHVVGGKSDEHSSLPTLVYQVLSDTWIELENTINQPWSRLGLVSIGMRLYGMGGEYGTNLSERNFSYQAIFTIVLPFVK